MLMEDMDINGDQSIKFEEFYDYLMKRSDIAIEETKAVDALEEEEEFEAQAETD